MTRNATRWNVLLGSMLGVLAFSGVASAALRVPQVAVLGGGLQSSLNTFDGGINALTAQDAAQTFTRTVSTNSGVSILVESTGNAANNAVGIYDGSAASPTLYQLLPGGAAAGWFAQASFRTGPVRLVVNLFDDNATLQGSTTYLGVDGTNFGFYIAGPGGTFYQQDARNPGGAAQVLSYNGTGINAGTWLLGFEDAAVSGPSDRDYDDCLVQVESVNPTPVQGTTWGVLKARFK